MKTHLLAKALRNLADILESGPNVELTKSVSLGGAAEESKHDEVAVSLHTLAALSRISKKEWLDLINSFGFDIQVKPRDSARNIIGKLLNYLDADPSAASALRQRSERAKKGESSRLLQALDILMKDV